MKPNSVNFSYVAQVEVRKPNGEISQHTRRGNVQAENKAQAIVQVQELMIEHLSYLGLKTINRPSVRCSTGPTHRRVLAELGFCASAPAEWLVMFTIEGVFAFLIYWICK